MTLKKITELGDITVSKMPFTYLLRMCFELPICKGKVWPATKNGKMIGNEEKFSNRDLLNHIEVTLSDDGKLQLEFSVILKFGTSISKITDTMCDYLAEEIKTYHGTTPDCFIINISGVKSKQLAKRNTKVVKHYDA